MRKGSIFVFALLFSTFVGIAIALTPQITLGAGHTGVTILEPAATRSQTALGVIQAYMTTTGTQLASPTDVKVQWADGFAEVYRYMGPPNEEQVIFKELIYPQSMVSGGPGYYRYFGGTGWVRVDYDCTYCFLYGEVQEVQQPPETSEP